MIVTPKNKAPLEEPDVSRLANMHDFAPCFEVPHIVSHRLHEQNDVPHVSIKKSVVSMMPYLGLASLRGNN